MRFVGAYFPKYFVFGEDKALHRDVTGVEDDLPAESREALTKHLPVVGVSIRETENKSMFYQDATGLQHESYEAACHYYGADSPAQLAAEEAIYAEEWADWAAEHGYFDELRCGEDYAASTNEFPF